MAVPQNTLSTAAPTGVWLQLRPGCQSRDLRSLQFLKQSVEGLPSPAEVATFGLLPGYKRNVPAEHAAEVTTAYHRTAISLRPSGDDRMLLCKHKHAPQIFLANRRIHFRL